MKSVISNERYCLVCGTPFNLERHHIFFGNPRRKLSEEYGFWVYLCAEHHRGTSGVHGNKGHELDQGLRRMAQTIWEKDYGTRDEFIEKFGRNYL